MLNVGEVCDIQMIVQKPTAECMTQLVGSVTPDARGRSDAVALNAEIGCWQQEL